ncbi:hypothetical protein ALC57_05420, partial [Trachymyrmex cornetzi]
IICIKFTTCRWLFNTNNICVRGPIIINIDIGVQAQLSSVRPALIIVTLHLHRTLARCSNSKSIRINTNTGIVGTFTIRSEAPMSIAYIYILVIFTMDIVFAMLYTQIQMLHYSESVSTIKSNIFKNKLFVNSTPGSFTGWCSSSSKRQCGRYIKGSVVIYSSVILTEIRYSRNYSHCTVFALLHYHINTVISVC